VAKAGDAPKAEVAGMTRTNLSRGMKVNKKPIEFKFFNEITDYTKQLGGLCADKYSYVPAVGDIINVRTDFLGISMGPGVATRKMADSKQLLAIKAKLNEWEELDDLDNKYLSKNFDFYNLSDEGDKYGFIVKLSVKVSDKFVKEKIGVLGDFGAGRHLESDGRKAKIIGTESDGYRMEVLLKGFINGYSVLATRAMDAFKNMHAKSTTVENVALSDRALPKTLVAELNASLDEICRQEVADYHPGSGKVVRDIVHPSLYCYVKGVSVVNGSSGNPLASDASDKPSKEEKDFWGRDYEDSSYQWLPAEFFVSDAGTARIDSYINNLDRLKYPAAYGILERMFEQVLPMFEAVCGSLRNDFYGVDSAQKGLKSVSLRNRSLQVVTKIVEYRVNREENFDGVWHVEGMSHEEILATALCVVHRDENFSGADIEFRRFLFEDEGNTLIHSTPQNATRPTDTMSGGDVRPLGCLKTPANRVIVFPNSHIHRLSSMYSSDGVDATRRIVVFWLVNPERPIVSTANVPPQQGVMSLDVAKRHRLALMAERKFHKESYEDREVGLCEH
jgi:hypothetical protein